MKYLRRTNGGQAIFKCPDCGCDIHASQELQRYLISDLKSQWGKKLANMLTPEERKAKAIKAINARWHKRDGAQISPTMEQSTEGQ